MFLEPFHQRKELILTFPTFKDEIVPHYTNY